MIAFTFSFVVTSTIVQDITSETESGRQMLQPIFYLMSNCTPGHWFYIRGMPSLMNSVKKGAVSGLYLLTLPTAGADSRFASGMNRATGDGLHPGRPG